MRMVESRDRHTCQCCYVYCGKSSEVKSHVHHILPLSLGGDNSFENMICLCAKCHAGVPPGPDDFLKYQAMGGQVTIEIVGKIFCDPGNRSYVEDLIFRDGWDPSRFIAVIRDENWEHAIAANDQDYGWTDWECWELVGSKKAKEIKLLKNSSPQ